jgi:protein-disulfide isomerase
VLEKYPQDVKLVFKNYPLTFHKYARDAAAAALAADRQGMFWEFHDLLFENQANLSDQKVKEIVEVLNLDRQKFSKDMEDLEVKGMVTKDKAEGTRIDVREVPTIFINGRRLKNISLQGFEIIIQKELKKLGKR